ncbi:MAG: 3-hydroxyacyl-CoA dehydrogenase NAD-binding domain-containing protein [Oleiphilaceae bacterium]|nr:3-hydroxyacyl-CoA dehydrogenase NAD-binding domain-containing protein [Oleiphilaceae bacterium]
MSSVIYEKDQNNIVHLILDKPNSGANLMDQEFTESMVAAVEQLKGDDFDGLVFRSNKTTFFAGGNLDDLFATQRENAQQLYDMVQSIKVSMRYLETCGKPVVACINGAALGGGWELALACHHRISVSEGVKLGLPEVTLGLLPGGGGVVRMSRLLGLQAALPYLTEGKQFQPEKGKELGLIDEIVASEDELVDAAIAFIKANPKVQQPYDVKGYKVPGGKPNNPALAKMLPIAPAMMRDKTKGVLPAPEAILSVMVESLQVDIDSAMRIETRYFVELVCGQVSKNMINTFWYQLNEINAGAARPEGVEKTKFKKLGVLGAGMMGAGIAYSASTRGIEVILKDVSQESAEKGKEYSQNILDKKVKKGRLSADKRDATLARIHPTADAADLEGCDIIIEAVFEDRGLKAKVTQEAEAQMLETGVFASNTSTLPITGLAESSARPERFIGLHFFSPVDKMPLVEIICGEQTSDETLARAYDFVQQIAKVPIVVNDSRGFYTSRVFGTYANEGMAMLGEGAPAAAVENAAFLSGFPVGPIAVTDEVSMTLVEKIRNQTIRDMEAEGKQYKVHPADAVVDKMLEASRPGKLAGGGFYEYPAAGKKHLWSGLTELFGQSTEFALEDLQDRLLYIQAIETVRCVEEKVLTSVRDANIGSIMGIGYPVWTGGILQFINQTGLPEFVERAEELHERFGDRFAVPELLKEMAQKGETFKD